MIAAFFGAGAEMSAYATALKVPNILRNLLGEGTLSASFVPVYSSLLGDRSSGRARHLASVILGLVVGVSGLVVALGLGAAPWLVRLIAPDYDRELAALTVTLIRILFPMAGLMIVGAWCMGVLTSHRRFFLPFAAPVVWNLAQIGGLAAGAKLGWEPLIVVLAWSTLAGGALQVAVQLPAVRRLAGSLRPRFAPDDPDARIVARNAGPVVAGQGIFQISSLIDVFLANLLVGMGFVGATSGLYFAQRIVQLPMALFGVSVAVAALPEMSRERAGASLAPHLSVGTRRIVYFVLPAAAILILYGDVVVGLIYQRGSFGPDDTRLVRWVLAAYAAGLVATSLIKLYASAFHAIRDTRTPMRYAALSVGTGIGVGASLMFWLVGLGLEDRAVSGLALGGATGAWLNLGLLVRGLRRRGIRPRGLAVPLLRDALGTLAAVAVSWPVHGWVSTRLPPSLAGRATTLGVVLAAGAIPYLWIAGRPRTPTRNDPASGDSAASDRVREERAPDDED